MKLKPTLRKLDLNEINSRTVIRGLGDDGWFKPRPTTQTLVSSKIVCLILFCLRSDLLDYRTPY